MPVWKQIYYLFFNFNNMSDVHILQLLAIMYLSIWIGAIIKPKTFERVLENFANNIAIGYLGWIIAVIIWYIMVAFHNTWWWNLSTVITVISWLCLLKGILLFLIPDWYSTTLKKLIKIKSLPTIFAVFTNLLGIGLLVIGYYI